MKTEPSPPRFTIKRGTQYWYNRKIPVDLIPAYSGKRLIRHRLNVGKRKDAEERATARTAELNVEFKRKRRELHAQQVASLVIAPPPTEIGLDEAQIRRLCLLWQRSVLETDDQNRIGGFAETDYDDLRENLTDAEPALRQALARGSFDVITPALHTFLFLCRVHVDEKSVAYKQLQHQFLQSIIQTIELQKGRLNGEVFRTDSVAPFSEVFKPKQTQPSEGVLGINELFELWKRAVSKRPLSTVSAFGTAANQFGAFVGDVPMSQITRKIVIQFRDKLKNEDGLNFKTIETKMALLSAMFQTAVDAEILESNPASRIKVAKPKNPPLSRLPYNIKNLQSIFAAPIYSGCIPKAGAGGAAIWLPALGLYTGARLEEMAQLLVADVVDDPKYGWYLNITEINDDDEKYADDNHDETHVDKKVKTPNSRRRVPLHPALIEAGFLRYLSRCKADGHDKVFPLLRPDSKGKYSGNWSKWWGRYGRGTIGIHSKLKVFYSLRHSFKQACREAGITEEVHDSLTGHSGGGVGRGYGGQFPLSQLFVAIRKIEFPGLVLPLIEPLL